MADERGVYVAVPFIFRFSDLLAGLSEAEGDIPGAFHHVSFRFVAGSPHRYPAAGSPWMLDPEAAGGGCLINLGVHFIDLFRLLTGREVTSVAAMTTSTTSVPFGSPIEEFAVVMLMDSGGTTGVIETGYTFPSAPVEQREFSFTLSSDRNYYRSGQDALEVRRRSAPGESIVRSVRLETDLYYPVFARRVMADIRNGGQPLAGLAEAEAVMRVIDAAYASARSAGEPQTLRPAGGAK